MSKYIDHQPSTLLTKQLKSDDAVLNLVDETAGALKVKIESGNVTLQATDIQIGTVEIKDHDGANRLDVVSAGEVIAAPTSYVISGHDGANARLLKTDAAGELQVDVLSSALPTGAATEATLGLVKAKTDNLDVLLSTRATEATLAARLADATFMARVGEVQAVPTANTVLARLKDLLTGIVLAVGNNVIGKVKIRNSADTADIDPASEATLASIKDTAGIKKITDALPAGANRIGKVTLRNSADLADIDPPSSGQLPAALTGSGNLKAAVLEALPAGNNNIGDVDVATLPALPAGTNNIGDVDVLTLPNVTIGAALPAGANNIGDVDVVTFPALPAGANTIGTVLLEKSNTPNTPAQTAVGTTAAQVLAAASRKLVIIQNTGTTVIKLVLGAGTPTQTVYHVSLKAGSTADDANGGIFVSDQWTGAIQAISSAAGGTIVITELT